MSGMLSIYPSSALSTAWAARRISLPRPRIDAPAGRRAGRGMAPFRMIRNTCGAFRRGTLVATGRSRSCARNIAIFAIIGSPPRSPIKISNSAAAPGAAWSAGAGLLAHHSGIVRATARALTEHRTLTGEMIDIIIFASGS